jgi:hypothetical protein
VRDFKNIDRLFQENLKDFEVAPPYKIWGAIDKKLDNTPRKRIIPIWAKISSIAVLLVLFFSVGSIYFIPQNNFTKNVLPKKDNTQKTITETDSTTKVATTSEVKDVKTPSIKGKVIPLNPIEGKNFSNKNAKNLASTSNSEEDTFRKKSSNEFSLIDTDNLVFEDTNNDIIQELSKNKFTVATIFAPIYFNSFGSGSGTDAQFNNNQTSGNTSYAYGVKIAYELNSKFSLQSGVNMINLGHTTNNVYLTPGVAIASLANISNLPISAKNADLSKEAINLSGENSANLNQVFGYVEIPVELKYNVTEGKIGVNLVGGFSTLLLNRDEVFVETNTFSQSLGNSNNLRSINFSGNFGVDVDYSIYKNVYINVSPMFKVQTNTFSKTSGSIQSYYLGVYTGLNYKF